MKSTITFAALVMTSAASAGIVTVEFDMSGTTVDDPAFVYGVQTLLDEYEGGAVLGVFFNDITVSFGDDGTGNGTSSLYWWLGVPFEGIYGLGFDAAGATGTTFTYDDPAGDSYYDLTQYGISVTTSAWGINTGTYVGGTSGTSIVSGSMGYILDVPGIPAPGALALIGLAGLGRRKRS